MSILQAYQANLLRDLDEGEGVSLDAIIELHQATDLSLRLNQYEIKGKKNVVTSVVERFQEAKKQGAVFQNILPRRTWIPETAGWKQPQASTSASHQAQQKQSDASPAPTTLGALGTEKMLQHWEAHPFRGGF